TLPQSVKKWRLFLFTPRMPENADCWYLRLLLRTGSERPRHCHTTENSHELAPLHCRSCPDACNHSLGDFIAQVQKVECPRWVNRVVSAMSALLPVHPQERTPSASVISFPEMPNR